MNIFERQALWLAGLQYLFLLAFVACMIVLIWMPGYWLQLAGTAVTLLIAGAVCKSGRS